jgi:formamidopyrimidine-DNA glycosylase
VLQVEPFMLRDCSADEVRRLLPGAGVADITRLGKFIVVRLEGDAGLCLTLHLGMTGQILLLPTPAGPKACPRRPRWGGLTMEKVAAMRTPVSMFRLRSCDGVPVLRSSATHASLGGCISPPVVRLLGSLVWDLTPGRVSGTWTTWPHAWPAAASLSRRSFWTSATWPASATSTRTRSCGGRGSARCARRARSMRRRSTALLERSVLRLGEGVRRLGCTVSDFVDTEGRPGTFQERLEAYGRQGETCSRCGETLKRVVIAGEGRPTALVASADDAAPTRVGADVGCANGGGTREEKGKKESRVHSLFACQRLPLRARFAVLRGHLPPRFLCGPLCELLGRCV